MSNNEENLRKNRKVVIVSGATNGFGYATAEILLKQGYTIIVTSRSLDRAKEAVETINNKQNLAIPMQLDLNDLNSVASFSQKRISRMMLYPTWS